MCLSTVKNNQMEITRVGGKVSEIRWDYSSPYLQQQSWACRAFSSWKLTIWLTLTKWIHIGGIHTSGQECEPCTCTCFVCTAHCFFCQLNEGAKSWHNSKLLTMKVGTAFIRCTEKGPQCLFQIARLRQKLNTNNNRGVPVWHIRMQPVWQPSDLIFYEDTFIWEPIKKLP